MKIEISLFELHDIISILSVWADDMAQIAPEEALKTRSIIMELEAQSESKHRIDPVEVTPCHAS